MPNSSKLDSPQEYFRQVLEPNYKVFMGTPSAFQSVFNAASSLFHMRDWAYTLKRAELEAALGERFPDLAAFWRYVERNVLGANFIRDVANASKHVELTHPSTSMTHIANVAIMTASSYGQDDYGEGRYGGAAELKIRDGSNDVSFDKCAENLFKFWEALVPRL